MAFIQGGDSTAAFSTVDLGLPFNLGKPTPLKLASGELDVLLTNGDIMSFFGSFTLTSGNTGASGTTTGALMVDPSLHLITAITGLNLATNFGGVPGSGVDVFGNTPDVFMSAVLAGNDFIVGGSSTETLSGGPGNDSMLGGSGAEVMLAGSGTDVLVGGKGPLTIVSTVHSGVDFFYSGSGGTTIQGASSVGAATGATALDAVVGFKTTDVISLSKSVSGFTSAADALAHVQADGHGNVSLVAGPQLLLLLGVNTTSLSAANFVLT